MKQKPAGRPSSSEKTIRDIKRKTRKQYSAEEKIRIILDRQRRWLFSRSPFLLRPPCGRLHTSYL